MNKILATCFCVLMTFVISFNSTGVSAQMNGVYTVNDGIATGGRNFNSFAELIDQLHSQGVSGRVVVDAAPGSGPYTERLQFADIPGASPVNTVRINGNGVTVQYLSSATFTREFNIINGTKHLCLDSFTFKTLGTAHGDPMRIFGGAAYDSITRCTFDLTTTIHNSNSTQAIAFMSSATSPSATAVNGTHCYIGYNKIQGPSGVNGVHNAIRITGLSDSNIIEYNTIADFRQCGVLVSDATGTIIRGNDINRKTKGTQTYTFHGVELQGKVPGTIVAGNKIHSPGGGGTAPALGAPFYGIFLNESAGTEAMPVMIYNNIVYNINHGWHTVYGVYILTTEHNHVYHNTVTIDQLFITASSNNTSGFYASKDNVKLYIKNNLVNITKGANGIKTGFYFFQSQVEDMQGNNFHLNSSLTGDQYYGYLLNWYADHQAFTTDFPDFEKGSTTLDPMFTDSENGNLLPGNTELSGTGVTLLDFVPKDIRGRSRGKYPTPGAYELDCIPTASLLEVDACDSFAINDSVYHTSGTYIQLLENKKGCDSTLTIELTLGNTAHYTVHDTVCNNELPFLWRGKTITTSGSAAAADTIRHPGLCDSILTLNLTVHGVSGSSDDITICSNELPYDWRGITLSAGGNGIAEDTVVNVAGCDSVIVLNLLVTDPVVPEVHISVSPDSIITAGTMVTFTAVAINEGSNPDFVWYKNGIKVSEGTGTWTDNTLDNEDEVHCIMRSDEPCVLPDSAVSNVIPIRISSFVVSESGNIMPLRLYPNPNSGSFVMEGIFSETYVLLEVISYTGQIIYCKELRPVHQKIREDVTLDVAPGIYFLKVNDQLRKLIVQ